MKKFLITYDLRKAGKNYNDLYQAIKDLGDWQHPLESTWVVRSNSTANVIFNKLFATMDQNDSLFVIAVESIQEHQGWLPKSFWEWFNK